MYTDFLVGIGYLLKHEDRIKLLRLALTLVDNGSIDFARVFYELSPFLTVDEKRKYGEEALRSDSCFLHDLLILSNCFYYLPRDDATKIIRSCIESLRQALPQADSSGKLLQGFTMFVVQRGLDSIVEYERDSVSAIANITEQDELLSDAVKCFEGSPIWLNRARLAQARVIYLRALGTSVARRSELLGEARKKTLSTIRFLDKVNDYDALFSGFRLRFLIDFRRLLMLSPKDRGAGNLLRQVRRHAEMLSKAAEVFGDPAKLAGSYTNTAIAMKLQAQHEPKITQRRRLYESAREMHLKAASIVRGVGEELPLHLYNAGSTLVELSLFEPNVVKLNELLEKASTEMDEVITLSSSPSQATVRFFAIVVKLVCMQELADISPVTLTRDVVVELESLSKGLEELEPRVHDPQVFPFGYLNLSRYYLKLLRVTSRDQEELIEKAEQNAFKAYQAAEALPNRESIRQMLPNLAEVLMVKGVLSHNLKTLEQASSVTDRARELLAGTKDPELLRTHSVAAEIHLVKYGYTGDRKELNKAIDRLNESAIVYVNNRYLQFAGEELFKLATVYMLIEDDRKARNALNKAAQLFKKSSETETAFKRESLKFSMICNATKKLLQAQIAFKTGDKASAKRIIERAEKEMVQAKARWREVWLIRGFKELILGNLEEARNNLVRVIKESLDVVEDKNPTSTGYTAKKLVSFMEGGSRVERRGLPPAAIDLPLRTGAMVAADKLNRLSKELSSVTSVGTRGGEERVNVEEIREMVRTLMGTKSGQEKKKDKK
nr:hypothetical protein [Candidatus Njordarchaeum guaymaensis]